MTELVSRGRRGAQDVARGPHTQGPAGSQHSLEWGTAEEELRRPRGESRRRAAAAPPETAAQDAGGGRRYSTSLRYGPTLTATRQGVASAGTPTGVPCKAPADVAALPAAVPAARVAENGAIRPEAPNLTVLTRRGVLGLSHKIAAVAAVSGIALAAAYPGFDGGAAVEQRVAQVVPSVAGVSVPASDEYKIARSSLSSSFTKDDQLDYLMSASGGDVTKVDTAGVLAQPLDSVRITSKFGTRVDPVSGFGIVSHIGQDYGAKCGTPVKAAASGKVVQAAWAGHSGNRIRVDHGNGLETTYNHNTSLKVAVGQKVERGEVVAVSGTTGNSTGCHLHFEVLVDGDAVDPAGWL